MHVPAVALLLSSLAMVPDPPPDVRWRNIGPGGGGWIQSICANPHDRDGLFVGCDVGGFYRSDDGGASYTIHNTGLTDYWVESIVPHPKIPGTLFIGCESGVYRSDDGGRRWRWLRNGFPEPHGHRWSAPIGSLAIDPAAPDTLYAGIGRPRLFKEGTGTLYKTTDGGESWLRVNAPDSLPPDALISDILVDPRDGKRLHLACQHGVFQSEDGGTTWHASTHGLPHPHARRLARSPSRPDTLYLTIRSEPGRAPWQGGVYRSDNGGKTWQPRLEGLRQIVGKPGSPDPLTANYDRIVVHPKDADTAYVGGSGWVNATLFKTTDGGKIWADVVRRGENPNIDMGWITDWGPTVKCLALSPLDPDVLYFGTSGHVFKTTDGGGRWQQAYCRTWPGGRFAGTGLEVTCLHAIAVHPKDPDRLYLGYYDIGLLVSRDRGKTFSRHLDGIAPRELQNSCLALAFDPDDPEHLWAAFGQWHENEGVIAESLDGGRSWSMIGTPETGLPKARHRPLLVDPSSPKAARRLLTVAEGQGVFTSKDGGRSWHSCNSGLPLADVRALAPVPGQPSAFFCTIGGKPGIPAAIGATTNYAKSWQIVCPALPTTDIKNLLVAPSDPRRLYLTAREKYASGKSLPGGVFRSDDAGATWHRILDDDFTDALAIDPRDPDVAFVGRTDHPFHDNSTGEGVWMTRDAGITWQPINGTTLTCLKVHTITLDPHDPSQIYIGTGGNGAFVARLPTPP